MAGRSAGPRGAEGYGAGRFLPAGGSRPRPPAELIGLERRAPAGRPAESPEGEHFAGAAPSDLIWGRHSAQAALESGRPIHRIWCTPEMRFSPRFLQLLREAKAGGVLVEEVTWARLGQISGGAVHQGIVLQPAAAETLDLPSLIEGCRGTGESPLLIAVDGLTDPQNLGAIVRSAEALGAHGLVLPQRRNAGLTGSVAKVAAGALEHLPVARVVNLNRSLEALKDEGYRVIGLASEGSVTLEEVDLDGPLVVVTGSEGDGLSLLTRKHCDQLVRIPLRGTTPSLNASVATALLLYEIARRGWMQGLRGSSPAPRLVRPALPAPAAAAESAVESAAVESQASDQAGSAVADSQLQAAAVAAAPAENRPEALPAPTAQTPEWPEALPERSAEPPAVGFAPVAASAEMVSDDQQVAAPWHAAIGPEPTPAVPERGDVAPESGSENASAPSAVASGTEVIRADQGSAAADLPQPPGWSGSAMQADAPVSQACSPATPAGSEAVVGAAASGPAQEPWTAAGQASLLSPPDVSAGAAASVVSDLPVVSPDVAPDREVGFGQDSRQGQDAAPGLSFEGDIRL